MDYLVYLILIPLFGSLASFLIGYVNKTVSAWVATICCGATFILAIKLDLLQVHYQWLYTWFTFNSTTVDFALRSGDPMPYLITGIGTLIHIFSIGYMSEDEGKHRFFSYLNLFIASMLILVLGSNLPTLFIGWEGVGLCSYLLIGFWFDNPEYVKAAQKAFIMNRIGDIGIIFAIILSLFVFGSTDFLLLKGTFETTEISCLIAFCLLFAATGKSAQLPLYTWLPDAMAGPTPVSALIHAATMVTAGIYLVVKTFSLFIISPTLLLIMLALGSITAIIAGLLACVQSDIKKILAYSTVSQLGFIFIALGIGAPQLAMFHLLTHAFFKACLFLTAGSVIHGCHGEQEIGKLGGLYKKMPISFVCYLVATLAITGIYPTAGYFSKHAILESVNGYYSVLFLSGLSILTGIYMFRSLILVFFGTYKGEKEPHESGLLILFPILFLALLSLVGGYWLAKGYSDIVGEHHIPGIFSGLGSSWTAFLSLAAIIVFIYSKFSLSAAATQIKSGFNLDSLYEIVIIRPLSGIAQYMYDIFENIIDGIISGLAGLTDLSSQASRSMQSGSLTLYVNLLMVFVFGLIIVCVIL